MLSFSPQRVILLFLSLHVLFVKFVHYVHKVPFTFYFLVCSLYWSILVLFILPFLSSPKCQAKCIRPYVQGFSCRPVISAAGLQTQSPRTHHASLTQATLLSFPMQPESSPIELRWIPWSLLLGCTKPQVILINLFISIISMLLITYLLVCRHHWLVS